VDRILRSSLSFRARSEATREESLLRGGYRLKIYHRDSSSHHQFSLRNDDALSE
jgi:hypothetical protein